MIREHEIPEGSNVCRHCHAKNPGPQSTCIVRDGAISSEKPRPEPARRVMACEDDSIAGRIAELRKEQEAAWNEPTSEPVALPMLRPRGLTWFKANLSADEIRLYAGAVSWIEKTEAPPPPPLIYKAGQPK